MQTVLAEGNIHHDLIQPHIFLLYKSFDAISNGGTFKASESTYDYRRGGGEDIISISFANVNIIFTIICVGITFDCPVHS